jgi:hypothetical protein
MPDAYQKNHDDWRMPEALWEQGLVEYDALEGIDREVLAMDGALTQAPPGEDKGGQEPYSAGKRVPSSACAPTVRACPSGSPYTARIGMISRGEIPLRLCS